MKTSNKLTLCVFIDALGWELSQRHEFLDDIVVDKRPLETIFGYSSTCDPTILTGVMPRDHQHFAFFAYDPAHSPFTHYKYFGLLPQCVMERGRVRARFSRIMKRVHGFTGYFQLYNMPFDKLHLFDYTERRDIFAPGGINGGQETIFDFLRDNKVPFCRPPGYDEAASIDQVRQATQTGAPAFAYLFLGRLDALLHQYGTDSTHVAEHIAWYDNRLRDLYHTACQHYETVHLHLFSDHGMTDITEVCDVMGPIQKLGVTFGEDYAAAYDSTMARFWFLKPGARARITTALEAVPQGHIMSDAELADYGCDFPANKYGELFFLMDPGVLLCPSHMGVKPLAAMHGYAPRDKDSTATFMSNVALAAPPKRLDDLYRLMRDEITSILDHDR